MRVEPFACGDLDEVGNVLNQRFLKVASIYLAEEGRRGAGPDDVGLDGRDEFILQPMQVLGRFGHNSREAVWGSGM